MPSEIRVGQIWEDNDKRFGTRRLRIEQIGVSHVVVENVETRRRTNVAIQRLRPNSTGYRLVAEPEAK